MVTENPNRENLNRWLRVREAAASLRVSETTIRSWLSTGKLDGFNRLPGRKVVGQQSPVTSGLEYVEDGVEDVT